MPVMHRKPSVGPIVAAASNGIADNYTWQQAIETMVSLVNDPAWFAVQIFCFRALNMMISEKGTLTMLASYPL